MFRYFVSVLCFSYVFGSVLRVSSKLESPSLLTLPSNATSIREDITDNFNCTDKDYGYYADVENGCQIFHVCLPVSFSDGKNTTFRWSFICPESTIFNQELLTCVREEDSINCDDSPMFYDVNANFGQKEEEPIENEEKNEEMMQELEEQMTNENINLRIYPEKTTVKSVKREIRKKL